MNNLKWTNARCKQLGILEGIIRDCCSIDRANNVCARIKRLEKAAELLTKFDLGAEHTNFMRFLSDLCREDREANGPKKAKH